VRVVIAPLLLSTPWSDGYASFIIDCSDQFLILILISDFWRGKTDESEKLSCSIALLFALCSSVVFCVHKINRHEEE